MAETPINLSRARKQRARDAKKTAGDANAVKFGRSKSEKQRDETLSDLNLRRLDGHKRDEDP